ncbi:hypothetical protein BGX38DRAFT_1273254 [Terfezia claveryi]|nr:hypothetical protein BGX38DRAFT_1273254 [Terfezia claveryi]
MGIEVERLREPENGVEGISENRVRQNKAGDKIDREVIEIDRVKVDDWGGEQAEMEVNEGKGDRDEVNIENRKRKERYLEQEDRGSKTSEKSVEVREVEHEDRVGKKVEGFDLEAIGDIPELTMELGNEWLTELDKQVEETKQEKRNLRDTLAEVDLRKRGILSSVDEEEASQELETNSDLKVKEVRALSWIKKHMGLETNKKLVLLKKGITLETSSKKLVLSTPQKMTPQKGGGD